MKLSEQMAQPISKEIAPLPRHDAEELCREIPRWSLGEFAIAREFRLKDFRQAMAFVNIVAAIANEQDHHPDVFISYNKVQLTLSTHKISGLSLNDFIVAAKIDLAADQQQTGQAA
jgi:4a-hydroxytetrahydrobiopterin dehydratase